MIIHEKPLKSEDFVSRINSLVNTSVGVLSTKKNSISFS
jgi:hypothetical protein